MKRLTKRLLALALVLAMSFSVGMVSSVSPAVAKKTIKLKKKTLSLTVGKKKSIVVKNVPKGAKVTFRSDVKSIATVNKKGVVKGVAEGMTYIFIRVKKGKKTLKELYCQINVKEAPYLPPVKSSFSGDKNAPLSDDFLAQVKDFSVGLFKACGQKDIHDGRNVLYSPLSVLTDMMMATDGAGGTNLAELSKVMCGSLGFTDFRQSLSDMNARLIYSDKVKFHMANSIWVRDDADRIQVKQSFIDDGEKYFNADTFTLPFDNAMVAKVNDWVNKNTLGMIPELMKQAPSEDDVMHLINALAFEGAWAETYEPYQVIKDQNFTNAEGDTEKGVNMLADTLSYYLHDDKAVGFVRPYKRDYSFVAILPNKEVGVEGYLSTMDGKTFRDFYQSGEDGWDVYTRIPEFSYDYSTELTEGLKAMGIREAFNQSADFSAMADTKSGALYIGKVVHKTHIELDRNGTKAAAVTDIAMTDTTSINPEQKKEITIHLDRPFIYAIVQSETGVPVFMGVVNTMSKR